MIPTLTNNIEILPTLLIFLLCVSGILLSIQLRKTKYVLRKTRMRYLSEKSAAAILRENETAIEMIERVNSFNLNWVKEGYNSGQNHNNVSATISIKEDEWEDVGEWMWNNKNNYNGLSVLPYDGGQYKDTPFQECTKEEYE